MISTTPLIQLQAQIYCEARTAGKPVRRLVPWLLDRRNVEAAFDRVRGADGANTPGVDGVTCADLERRAATWLSRLADDVLHGRYQPQPIRWSRWPRWCRPASRVRASTRSGCPSRRPPACWC